MDQNIVTFLKKPFRDLKDKTPFIIFTRREVIIIMAGNTRPRTVEYGHNTYYLKNGSMIFWT